MSKDKNNKLKTIQTQKLLKNVFKTEKQQARLYLTI